MADTYQPIFILPEGSHRSSGRSAQSGNIAAAKAVAETVRTTLGPRGMDKMLVDAIGNIIVTNDGVTILREMDIEHPAAKMIVEVAKTQEEEVGDGTTTAVVLAGEFLKHAEDLLEQNIHPTIISNGYRIALDHALESLASIARPIMATDTQLLKNIATTAMTGKGVENAREHLASIAVEAVQTVHSIKEGVDLHAIKIEKKHGARLMDTELIGGIILDKERVHSAMPRIVRDARILLLDCPIEIKSTEIDAKITIKDPSQIQGFLDMEETMLRRMVDAIGDSGASVVFTLKGIDDYAQGLLAKKGIYALRRVSKSDLRTIEQATRARIVSDIDAIQPEHLGSAGIVSQERIGDEHMTFIKECTNPKAVTILVRASTEHLTDEAKRAIEDALGDLKASLSSGRIVAGAGAPEAHIARQLKKLAQQHQGREQLAILAFANAVEIIPKTLAENSGLDPIDALTSLRSAHEKGTPHYGMDVVSGGVIDAWKEGIIEPLAVKTRALQSAADVSIMLLRIDDVISMAKRKDRAPLDQNTF